MINNRQYRKQEMSRTTILLGKFYKILNVRYNSSLQEKSKIEYVDKSVSGREP